MTLIAEPSIKLSGTSLQGKSERTLKVGFVKKHVWPATPGEGQLTGRVGFEIGWGSSKVTVSVENLDIMKQFAQELLEWCDRDDVRHFLEAAKLREAVKDG